MSTSNPYDTPPERPEFAPYSPVGARGGAFRHLPYLFALLAIALLTKVGWNFWHLHHEFQPKEETEFASPYAKPSAIAAPPRSGGVESPADRFNKPPASTAIPGAAANSQAARAQLDWAKSAQRSTMELAKSIRHHCDEWQRELTRWNSTVTALLDNADGKRLAADPNAVRSFRIVSEQPRGDLTCQAAVLRVVSELTDNVAAALKDPDNTYVPTTDATARLQQLSEEARTTTISYRNAQTQLQVLVDASRRAGKSSDYSLSIAVAAQQLADQSAALAEARAQIEAARQQTAVQVAAARAEAIRMVGNVETKLIMDAIANAKARTQKDVAQMAAGLAMQQRSDALQRDRQDIQRYLAPFIAKGRAQPNGYHNTQLADVLPMSWSRLSASGALQPTREGMEQLMRYATVSNDRPRGEFPQYVGGDFAWSQTNKPFVRRAQELLTQHGQAMVEAGLLSE